MGEVGGAGFPAVGGEVAAAVAAGGFGAGAQGERDGGEFGVMTAYHCPCVFQ
jgi:hypothetical protein